MLTSREHEILALMADGLTSKQIAQKLRIAAFTVKEHRKHLLKALCARNAPHAIALGYRRGLLEAA